MQEVETLHTSSWNRYKNTLKIWKKSIGPFLFSYLGTSHLNLRFVEFTSLVSYWASDVPAFSPALRVLGCVRFPSTDFGGIYWNWWSRSFFFSTIFSSLYQIPLALPSRDMEETRRFLRFSWFLQKCIPGSCVWNLPKPVESFVFSTIFRAPIFPALWSIHTRENIIYTVFVNLLRNFVECVRFHTPPLNSTR